MKKQGYKTKAQLSHKARLVCNLSIDYSMALTYDNHEPT